VTPSDKRRSPFIEEVSAALDIRAHFQKLRRPHPWQTPCRLAAILIDENDAQSTWLVQAVSRMGNDTVWAQ